MCFSKFTYVNSSYLGCFRKVEPDLPLSTIEAGDVFAGIVECNASILHLKLFFSLQNALYKAKVKNYCFFRSHLSASRNNIWEQ